MTVLHCQTFQAAKRKKRIEEGWEYARLPNLSYHTTEHTFDLARRRRYHRKLVNVDPGKPPIFYFADEKKKKKVKQKVLHNIYCEILTIVFNSCRRRMKRKTMMMTLHLLPECS